MQKYPKYQSKLRVVVSEPAGEQLVVANTSSRQGKHCRSLEGRVDICFRSELLGAGEGFQVLFSAVACSPALARPFNYRALASAENQGCHLSRRINARTR